MSHLGERVSALADGQLSAADTERAMCHLAGCRQCRDAVETERLTKARLACLPGPQPAADLVGRLLAMGGPSGPLPPRPGHVPGTPRPQPVPVSRPDPVPVGADVAVAAVVAVPSGGGVAARTLVRVSGPADGARRQALPGPAVRRPALRRPAARPRPVRPSGHPSGLTLRRARLASVVIGALGVVGAGVGGLVLAAPSLPSGAAGSDSLTIQRQAATASAAPAGEPRSSTPSVGTARPVAGNAAGAPAALLLASPSAAVSASIAPDDPLAVLGADMTGLPPVPGAAFRAGR